MQRTWDRWFEALSCFGRRLSKSSVDRRPLCLKRWCKIVNWFIWLLCRIMLMKSERMGWRTSLTGLRTHPNGHNIKVCSIFLLKFIYLVTSLRLCYRENSRISVSLIPFTTQNVNETPVRSIAKDLAVLGHDLTSFSFSFRFYDSIFTCFFGTVLSDIWMRFSSGEKLQDAGRDFE